MNGVRYHYTNDLTTMIRWKVDLNGIHLFTNKVISLWVMVSEGRWMYCKVPAGAYTLPNGRVLLIKKIY